MTPPKDVPLVTTVIPTFRRPLLLRNAIASALGQSMDRLVVAVWDNASGDETSDVVANLAARDPRVRFESHPENIGSTANYNHALSRIDTPFFSLMGDDDLLLPDLYREAMLGFEEYPEAMFFCARTVVDDRLDGILRHRNRAWKRGFYRPDIAIVTRMVRDHFINTGVVFRKEILDSVGLIDQFGSDRNYVAIASSLHPFVVSERELAVFAVHGQSFTGGTTNGEFNPEQGSSWNAASVIGASRELETRLGTAFPDDAGQAILTAIRAQMRRDLVYAYFVRSLPAGRAGEISALLEPSTGFGALSRVAFRTIRVLTGWTLGRSALRLAAGLARRTLTMIQMIGGSATPRSTTMNQKR